MENALSQQYAALRSVPAGRPSLKSITPAIYRLRRTVTKPGETLGADKAYDVAVFVKDLRKSKITPHVAQKKNSAIDARTTRHEGYKVSLLFSTPC